MFYKFIKQEGLLNIFYCEVSDMKRAASVFLRADITVNDAYSLIEWMKNEKVVRYLNESPKVTESIRSVINRSCSPYLTMYFNSNGRFFMIDTEDKKPIGFIKLVETSMKNAYEIVIAIGEDKIWGQGFGRDAVLKCLQMVFYEWRADMIIANIHSDNRHSINLFEKIGLQKERENQNTIRYKITMKEFLKRA